MTHRDVVYTFEVPIDLRLPGQGTFEQCPKALAALNAAYGWVGGDAPVPPGLREATHTARATHRWRGRAHLHRDGTITLDTYAATAQRLEGALIEHERKGRRLFARYRYARTETHVYAGGAAWDLEALTDDGETEADALRRTLASGRLFTRADVHAALDVLRRYGGPSKPRVIVVSVYRRRK